MADPMYRQIADDLRDQIDSGALAHGDQLATEIELMEHYGASRNTVRDAIKLLVTRGLVDTRPGRGTFVVEKVDPIFTTLTVDPEGGEGTLYTDEVAAMGRQARTTKPRVEIQQARVEVADALGIAQGTEVVCRHQQRFIDNIPWSLQTSFYPMRFVQEGATKLLLAENIEVGAVRYLAQIGLSKQVSYQDLILVRPPDQNETAFFKLPADGRVPVFEISRIGFGADGSRVRLTVTVYPTDRNRFVINVGEIPTTPSRG